MVTTSEPDAVQSFSLPAELSQLKEIRSAVRSVCENAPFAKDHPEFHKGLAELELAITELVSNVIRHGHEDIKNGLLQFELSADDSAFQLQLIHNGNHFDGNSADITEITDPQEGGMGLYLISQCVDQVDYGLTEAGSSRIRLTRAFSSSEGDIQS